jgi:hypothetical protein
VTSLSVSYLGAVPGRLDVSHPIPCAIEPPCWDWLEHGGVGVEGQHPGVHNSTLAGVQGQVQGCITGRPPATPRDQTTVAEQEPRGEFQAYKCCQ